MKQTHRRQYILLAATIILSGIIILISAAFYMQWYALEAQGNERGKNHEDSYKYMYAKYPILHNWVDSLNKHKALRDTFITADDQTRLHALYIYADSVTPNTAVVIHGYTDNAVRMLHIAYLYNHDLHYNVLLPELRYSGTSEGTHIQMGWLDSKDVIKWMDIANQIFSVPDSTGEKTTQMVVHGISMGAATTMCVSGEPQKNYVNCFIEDCGYTSVWDEYSKELYNQFSLPEFPLLHITSWLTQLRYGWNFKEASPLEQIKKSHYPMLFIHGDADNFVPTWMGDTLYANYKGPKEYWRVPDVAHAESYLKFPKEYTNYVKKFVNKYNH